MKNRDADSNNPNVYQYIEEDDERKLENLYDEIKQGPSSQGMFPTWIQYFTA